MANRMKLVTILGTRPEIIRLSEIIKACDKTFDHILVHTGQNYDYELNQIFFEELNIRKPDYYLECAHENLGKTIGDVISKTYDLLKELKPDAILILGDTNSALSAIAAKRLKLPIFHMEAGNRCGDWNVPETINRKIVDHISDINFPYTDYAYQNLINEGIDPKYIFISGSPMKEVLDANNAKINNSNILDKLNLEKGKYIVRSSHREENIDIKNNFISLIESLNGVAKTYKMPIIFSTHPRTRKRIESSGVKLSKYITNIKPLGFIDYVKLQENAFITLSDSGTLTEESYLRKFPAVLIRTTTERPEGVNAGSIIVSGINKDDVLRSIEVELNNYLNRKPIVHYETPNVSDMIINTIKSCVDVVNKEIWRK